MSADVLIIGGGPAGLTAAIYARRAGLSCVVFEKLFGGGQVASTPDVSNYPGLPDVAGFELAQRFESHAVALGAGFERAEVLGLDLTPDSLGITTATGRVDGKTVILAMGASRRKLGIPGEEAFAGRGVSYCATCDGAFFKGRDVAVVGGGNTALEDAVYLAGLCRKVYLVHRRSQFRGGAALSKAALENPAVAPVLEYVPVEITGDSAVSELRVRHVTTGEEQVLSVSGVFAAVGTSAESGLLEDRLPLDGQGRVVSGEDCRTPIPGVFVAGDLRAKGLYQIVTATSDGAVAATEAFKFITGQ